VKVIDVRPLRSPPDSPKSAFIKRESSSARISINTGSTTSHRPCESTCCWSSKRFMRDIIIAGETVAVGSDVAPGIRAVTGIE